MVVPTVATDRDQRGVTAKANWVEPAPRRLRATLRGEGEYIFDTIRAGYVWECPFYPQYYIPVDDIDARFLVDEHHEQRLRQGAALRHGLRAGDRGVFGDLGDEKPSSPPTGLRWLRCTSTAYGRRWTHCCDQDSSAGPSTCPPAPQWTCVSCSESRCHWDGSARRRTGCAPIRGSDGTAERHDQGRRTVTGRARQWMIAATSEALIDLVINQHGRLGAQAGGGPLNMAKIIGRLGLAPAFLSRLSQDGPGRVLGARLDQDGVMLRAPQLTDAPAILAVADVDPAGAPVNSDDSAPPPRARQATELRQIRRRAPWAVMAVTGSTQAGALIGKVMDDAARPADRG